MKGEQLEKAKQCVQKVIGERQKGFEDIMSQDGDGIIHKVRSGQGKYLYDMMEEIKQDIFKELETK